MSREPKKTTVSALGLPQDVILGDVLISLVDRSQMNVESYRDILIYTNTLIELQARNCKMMIHEARLKIDYYAVEEMEIADQVGSSGPKT